MARALRRLQLSTRHLRHPRFQGMAKIPDLQQRFPLGGGDVAGTSEATRVPKSLNNGNTYIPGDIGGDWHTQEHKHTLIVPSRGTTGGSTPTNLCRGNDSGMNATFTSEKFGSGYAENVPPFLTVNFIIKYK